MSVTRSTHVKAAKSAKSIPTPENLRSYVPNQLRSDIRNNRRNAVRNNAEDAHRSSGFGLPCANCRLYYPATLDACPACNSKERVSPHVVPALPKVPTAAKPSPGNAVVEQKNEAFLHQFQAQLFTTHTEPASSPLVCTLGEHQLQGPGAPSICKPCYDRLQQRMDVCQAALHMDLKEAAQIIHDAVWADPSHPSKSCTNAASALLIELRKRSGVPTLPSLFRPPTH
jgi:hypothetical protein